MPYHLFHEIADLSERRQALLQNADTTLQNLLAEIGASAPGVLAALEHPCTYDARVGLAIHQLRRQIVVTGQPEWVRQLNDLTFAARAIWTASEIAQHR